MNRFLRIALLSTAICFFGCASTQDAERRALSQFSGKPADSFFSAYGPPVQQFKTQDGATVYTWTSNPGSWGGQRIVPVCTLQINAAPDGRVTHISARDDSIGWWTTSACSEVIR